MIFYCSIYIIGSYQHQRLLILKSDLHMYFLKARRMNIPVFFIPIFWFIVWEMLIFPWGVLISSCWKIYSLCNPFFTWFAIPLENIAASKLWILSNFSAENSLEASFIQNLKSICQHIKYILNFYHFNAPSSLSLHCSYLEGSSNQYSLINGRISYFIIIRSIFSSSTLSRQK